MDTDIIVALIGVGGILIGLIWTGIANLIRNNQILKNTKSQSKREQLKEKRDALQKKLDDFYYPLNNYLNDSKTLFKIFKEDKPVDFRTLTFLLNPTQLYNGNVVALTGNDHVLLKRIFEIGYEIEKLIHEKSSLVSDDPELMGKYVPDSAYAHLAYPDLSIINLLTAHLRIIKNAYEGDLTGQMEKFQVYVFPNEINGRVHNKISTLKNDIERLDKEMEAIVVAMKG